MTLEFEEKAYWTAGSVYHAQLTPRFDLPTRWVPIHKTWELNRFLESNDQLRLQQEVQQGEGMLLSLGEAFLKANRGNYVAISYATGKPVGMAKTLDGLNKSLIDNKVRENCYVARIGFRGIASII